MRTAHRKIVAAEKLANIENPALFAKIFIAIILRYTENVFSICTHCNLFANFFLANTSYLYGSPKFSHVQYLYLNTYKSTCILLKYFSQNNAMYLYFNKCQSTCTLFKYFHMYFAPCLVIALFCVIYLLY